MTVTKLNNMSTVKQYTVSSLPVAPPLQQPEAYVRGCDDTYNMVGKDYKVQEDYRNGGYETGTIIKNNDRKGGYILKNVAHFNDGFGNTSHIEATYYIEGNGRFDPVRSRSTAKTKEGKPISVTAEDARSVLALIRRNAERALDP